MKNVIVTGASRGIGYQISIQLAEKGHRVYAIARSESKLNALAATNVNIIPIVADLTSEIGQHDVKSVLDEINRVDILINNAAKLDNVSFMKSNIQAWKQLFEVNLFSIIELIQFCKPKMISGGHIVNIGSMGGVQGSKKFTGLSTYSTSKGALAILTECLALEFSPDQIAVNCLALGAVSTEMQREAFPDFEAPVSATEMGKFISDFALNGHTFINGKILPISFSDPE
ncbi:MAG: SDR family oxidoreductase [Balneolaceae bacterium]|nr:SDR family oxidoreductase [Balneolaceae bacterium]